MFYIHISKTHQSLCLFFLLYHLRLQSEFQARYHHSPGSSHWPTSVQSPVLQQIWAPGWPGDPAGLGVTMLIAPHHRPPAGSESGGRGFNKHLRDSDTSDLQSMPWRTYHSITALCRIESTSLDWPGLTSPLKNKRTGHTPGIGTPQAWPHLVIRHSQPPP